MVSMYWLRYLFNVLFICNAIPAALTINVVYEGPNYVVEGSGFTLKCQVEGRNDAFRWTVDLEPIQGREFSTQTHVLTSDGRTTTTSTLRVYKADAKFGGSYKCDKSSDTQHEIVILRGYKTNEPQRGKPFVVEFGKSFDLQCNVDSVPFQKIPLIVDWIKSDRLIREDGKKYLIFPGNNTLRVLNAAKEDCITYSCRFLNMDKFPSYYMSVKCQPPSEKKNGATTWSSWGIVAGVVSSTAVLYIL